MDIMLEAAATLEDGTIIPTRSHKGVLVCDAHDRDPVFTAHHLLCVA